MPRFVAVVEADVDRIGFCFRNIVDIGANTFSIGQVGRRGNLRAGGRSRGGIDGKDVEILVAVIVLCKKDILAVPTPKIPRDWSLLFGSQRTCLCELLVNALDPDVANVGKRLDERNIFAVRRDLSTRIFRIIEENSSVDQRRLLGRSLTRKNKRDRINVDRKSDIFIVFTY